MNCLFLLVSAHASESAAERPANYVALENAPGCGSKLVMDESECTKAAKELGYQGSALVGSWSFAPHGCHIGTAENGWANTFFNTDINGETGDSRWRSICRISLDYVALDNGPGCEAKLLLDESECTRAAKELGYKSSAKVGSWDFAPYGCHVGTAANGWADTFFNTDTKGQTGDSRWRSICRFRQASTDYVASDNAPGCEAKLLVFESECTRAAQELGYKATARVGSWNFAPYGCHVGIGENGWANTFFNTNIKGETGDKKWRSICKISQDYVALDNGPGCGSELQLDQSECAKAAKGLGYNASAKVGSWNFAPYGCHVGTGENGWQDTFFNTDIKGETGDNRWRSICRISQDFVALDNGPGCESSLEVEESECTRAAKELGFKASARVGSWSFAPYGCHVGTGENGWRNTYFNTDINGQTGDKKWKSICRTSASWNTIIIIASVLAALFLLALVVMIVVFRRQRKNNSIQNDPVDLE